MATLGQTQNKVQIDAYQHIRIAKVEIQWVNGMSFDDHEENFVTLHNRNSTKIILEQFDRNRTSLEVG